MKKATLALIPARGGSKGIKNKNIVEIDTLPMVAYAILAAKAVSGIHEVYVSSDNKRILQKAETYGAVPLRRPSELAQDRSSTESVVAHFLNNVSCADVVLIQPTSPMLKAEDLEAGLAKYREGEYDSLFSAVKTNDTLIWDEDSVYPLNYDPRNRGRRQTRSRYILIENGAFFIFSRKCFTKNLCRLAGKIGYSEMPYWRSFQVDDMQDLNHIRTLMTVKG